MSFMQVIFLCGEYHHWEFTYVVSYSQIYRSWLGHVPKEETDVNNDNDNM